MSLGVSFVSLALSTPLQTRINLLLPRLLRGFRQLEPWRFAPAACASSVASLRQQLIPQQRRPLVSTARSPRLPLHRPPSATQSEGITQTSKASQICTAKCRQGSFSQIHEGGSSCPPSTIHVCHPTHIRRTRPVLPRWRHAIKAIQGFANLVAQVQRDLCESVREWSMAQHSR